MAASSAFMLTTLRTQLNPFAGAFRRASFLLSSDTAGKSVLRLSGRLQSGGLPDEEQLDEFLVAEGDQFKRASVIPIHVLEALRGRSILSDSMSTSVALAQVEAELVHALGRVRQLRSTGA